MNYTFKLPTDHFQFYVQDRQSRPDTSMIWDEITELNRIAVEPGLIAVNTVRFGGLTLIELTIHHDHPVYVADNWEHIVHCSIRACSVTKPLKEHHFYHVFDFHTVFDNPRSDEYFSAFDPTKQCR